ISLEICSHCRQLVGCQMPNFFSRIAGLSPRVSAASTKLFAIVSATVSTAGLAMLVPSLLTRLRSQLCQPVLLPKQDPYLTPRFLLFPAPFAPRAGFLGAKVKFLHLI